MPSLPKWPSRRKATKRKPRRVDGGADGDEPEPKRKCTRSRVAGVFTSGANAALIRDQFPNQKGVVVLETAPLPEDLLNISLEEVVFTAEWLPEAILPDRLHVDSSSQDEITDVVPVLEPEKEKPVAQRSSCLRSSAPGQARKKKGRRKRRVRTQDMIENRTYYSDESAPESVEDGCLLLGLTQDVIDLA